MGKGENPKPDGAEPFGSSPADWAIPGVDREPVVLPQPADASIGTESVDEVGVSRPEAPAPRPRRRLMLPPTDDLPQPVPGEELPDLVAGLQLAGEELSDLLAGFSRGRGLPDGARGT